MLTKRALSTLLTLLMLFLGGGVLASCGGDEEEGAKRPKRTSAADRGRKRKTGNEVDPTAVVTLQLNKPRWQVLEPHFRKLLKQKHAPAKDVFMPQSLNFIPRPELPKTEEDEDVALEIEATVDAPKGPLEQYAIKDYNLLMVMSGTAMPKAVVIDPSGNAFAIQVDDRIGSAGGTVESISQYTLVIREPNVEEPFVLSIEPPFANLATRVDPDGEGRPNIMVPQMLMAPAARK